MEQSEPEDFKTQLNKMKKSGLDEQQIGNLRILRFRYLRGDFSGDDPWQVSTGEDNGLEAIQ